MCDANNSVLFRKNGGLVIPDKDLKVIIRPGSPVTNVRRRGNTYGLDAWVKRSQLQKSPKSNAMDVDGTSSFTRQGATP